MKPKWITLNVGDDLLRHKATAAFGLSGHVTNYYPDRDIMRVVWETGRVEYYPQRVKTTMRVVRVVT